MLTMTARPGLSVLVFTALAVGCVENVTEPVDEPPAIDDELLEFYTAFCTHWEGCDIDFSARWSSVGECAEDRARAYQNLPNICLARVLEYHQCVIDMYCDWYMPLGEAFTCKTERLAIKDVDCGGMSAP